MTKSSHNKAYYQKHKKEINARQARYRKKHKKRLYANARLWKKNNPQANAPQCRKYYKKNKKQIEAKKRAWRLKNPKRYKFLTRRWYHKYKNDPRRIRRVKVAQLKRYGISLEEFSDLRQKQKNCCEICRKQFDRTPHVDHSHATGKVRGLLCFTCNIGLGSFKDSKILLRSAANYLTRKEKL